MAPKKSTVQKKVAAAVADKTFGLKNKNKSKKVQEYVTGVKNAAKNMGRSRASVVEEEKRRKDKEAVKAAKAAQEMEMNALFRTVVDTKQTVVPAGVDPRTVICAYFKAGKCVRGQKCKFSHNLENERKTSKLSLYVDLRDNEKQSDSMDKWDQAKLEAVVEAAAKKKPTNETQIVCKHFLDAIEKLKYGWFWECPTDKKAREEHLPVGCIYKHRLPPGFVFTPKVDKKLEDVDEDDTALQLMESIEEERKRLDLSKCTPVTLETFKKWKADKQKKKEEELEKKRKEEAKKSGGRGLGVLSGRDLFKYDPSLFVDDADAVDDKEYQIEDQNETEEEMRARVAAESAAEEEEMKRRAQFEARAELYRNDASADATSAIPAVAEATDGGTTTAVAFQLPASLMAKPKPVVGDASLFDDDEAPADGDDGDGDADGDADGGDGDGDGDADADAGDDAAAGDGDAGDGDGEAADAEADADAGGDAEADAEPAADSEAAADAETETENSDEKSKPASAAAPATATAAAPTGSAKPAAVAVVGDASLFDEDLSDLPDG